jgi:hypothetical protein
MSPTGYVKFQIENRYEARYPGLRVIPEQTLRVIKRLRAAGVRVEIEGDERQPLLYTFEKGIGEALADPTVAFAVNIAASFLVNILSNWLWDRIGRDREFPSATIAILAQDEDGEVHCYGPDGLPLKRAQVNEVLGRAGKAARAYAESMRLAPPQTDRTYPVYLEHTGRVVGWAAGFIKNAERGTTQIVDLEIVDPQTKRRFDSGELSGFSVAGIAKVAVCSICGGDYTKCDHITGDIYDGQSCVATVQEWLLGEFSLVADPINPATKILR